jgi:DNA polymerase elongation subunit (family B)
VHAAIDAGEAAPRSPVSFEFQPFAWLGGQAMDHTHLAGVSIEVLKGEGVFRHLAHAQGAKPFETLLRQARDAGAVDAIRPLESEFLLQRKWRLFRDVPFHALRRCQLDLRWADDGRIQGMEVSTGGKRHRLLAEKDDDGGEAELLLRFNAWLADSDPDVIEGHGLFTGPLDHLRERARQRKVPCLWGRFGQRASFRNSRLKAAERWIDYTRCDAPGRAVVDTQLLVQIYDISARELSGYGRAAAAEYFGVGSDDPLLESKALGDLLLPTYFEQARAFPILLQDATLRGQTSKIDLLFQEAYYHARQALPVPPEIAPFEGGYTRSFHEGVFRHVLHFDVASLYPSLLLAMGRNPSSDTLGVFIPLLRSLREYRLQYKQRARSAPTAEERAEAQARQTAFKILINSFYGYLGFSGARFGDGELAAEVTRRGRELLQALIEEFNRLGCTVLEADTDGIYLSSEKFAKEPEVLLDLVEGVLPPGIELEYDGHYEAMVCYKAKNYALYDGKELTLRGSAFRSRAMEPFLQRLTDHLLGHLVGLEAESPESLWQTYRNRIATQALPVGELAKSEVLSQSPDAYERLMAEVGKPRRASAEAALQLSPRPRMGERVSYYVTAKRKGRTSDWQRARPVSAYDPNSAPYDPHYYLEKLDDWKTRYGLFLPQAPSGPTETQTELL